MTDREQRRKQLEAIARGTPDGSDQILGLHMNVTGKLPPIGSLVVQQMIPEILDAEFAESTDKSTH